MKPIELVLPFTTWRRSQPIDQVNSWLGSSRAEVALAECGLWRCTPLTIGSTRSVISSTTTSTSAAATAPASARPSSEIEIDEFIGAPGDRDQDQRDDDEDEPAGVRAAQERPRPPEIGHQLLAHAGEELLRVR